MKQPLDKNMSGCVLRFLLKMSLRGPKDLQADVVNKGCLTVSFSSDVRNDPVVRVRGSLGPTVRSHPQTYIRDACSNFLDGTAICLWCEL